LGRGKVKEIEAFRRAAKALVEKLPDLVDERWESTRRRDVVERRGDAEVVAATAAGVLAMAERIVQALTPPSPPTEHHVHNHPRPLSPLAAETPAWSRQTLTGL